MQFRGGVQLDLPLARQAIDRDYLARTRPELFDELWSDSTTRVLAMFEGSVLLDGQSLRLLTVESVPSASYRVYLGRDSEGPVVLAVLSENAAKQLEPAAENWHHLRKTGAGLNDRDAGLLTARIFAEAYGLRIAADAILEPDRERNQTMHHRAAFAKQLLRARRTAWHQRTILLVEHEHLNLRWHYCLRRSCER